MLGDHDLGDLPDFARLGLQLDDDDDVQPRAPRRDFIAADLVADIQRRQQQSTERPPFDSPIVAAKLHGNAFADLADTPTGTPTMKPATSRDASSDVLRFFREREASASAVAGGLKSANSSGEAGRLGSAHGGSREGGGPVSASANVKALQALQHRSRHPNGHPSASDVAKSAVFDPSLYGSLPPDIGSLDCTVYVQYLPVTMREIEFMNLIIEHGDPRRVRICGNPKKEHNWTYGFVEYGSPEEAGRFIANCDGIRAGPFRMRCNIAKTPIVDRLAIDAPPDGKCTFAQKFPNRTLRELILASIAVTEEQQVSHLTQGPSVEQRVAVATANPHAGIPAGAATVAGPHTGDPIAPRAVAGHGAASAVSIVQSPLSIPTDFVIPIIAAVKDAVNFFTDHNQSSFYSAKGAIAVVMEHAKRRNETISPARCIATLLNGTDVVFLCRMLLTVLHVVHGSYEDALTYGLAALQSLPSSIDIVSYLNKLDPELEAFNAPRGFTPLVLNHLCCFGLALESVSALAARSFYQVAHHRAAMHGVSVSKTIETVLASDLVPLAYPVSDPAQHSLLVALFPMFAVDGSFPGYVLDHVAKSASLATSCVSLFAYNTAIGTSPEPGPIVATSPITLGPESNVLSRQSW
jgi:hypothetical protein